MRRTSDFRVTSSHSAPRILYLHTPTPRLGRSLQRGESAFAEPSRASDPRRGARSDRPNLESPGAVSRGDRFDPRAASRRAIAHRRPMVRSELCCVSVLEREEHPTACVLNAPCAEGAVSNRCVVSATYLRLVCHRDYRRCDSTTSRSTQRTCPSRPARNSSDARSIAHWAAESSCPAAGTTSRALAFLEAFNPPKLCCAGKPDPLQRRRHSTEGNIFLSATYGDAPIVRLWLDRDRVRCFMPASSQVADSDLTSGRTKAFLGCVPLRSGRGSAATCCIGPARSNVERTGLMRWTGCGCTPDPVEHGCVRGRIGCRTGPPSAPSGTSRDHACGGRVSHGRTGRSQVCVTPANGAARSIGL